MNGHRKYNTIPLLKIDNVEYTEDIDLVEHLADHFESVSSTDNYCLQFLRTKATVEIPLDFQTQREHEYNRPFTMEEFENALKHTGNTSVGPDNIPYAMLRHLPVVIKELILRFLNKIWHSCKYPNIWREAIIIPVLKPGKKPSHPTSYRPISLTCHLSKVYERMINLRLVWFLESNQLIDLRQCGSRKMHSTTDLHVYFTNAIQNSIVDRKHLVAVFFDLEKAFDMTWRYGILRKLHGWGLRGNLPLFIENFLCDRSFKVRIGDTYSSSHPLENGIPQGSTISVTLFMIAINDIANNLPNSVDHCLYVDDLTIFTSATSVEVCKRRLQNSVDIVTHTASMCGFRFSAEKTKVVDFCRLRTPHACPDLTMYGAAIQKDAVVKFLGLYYDSYLTWSRHITHLSGQCRMSLNAIKCLSSTKWGADRECLQRLYTALVQSKLEYGCLAFFSAKHCHLRKLDAILNAGIRIITGAFRTSPVESLRCEAGIAPLKFRFMRISMKYTIGVLTKPQHLNNSVLFHNQTAIDIYRNSTSKMCPVAIKLVQQLDNLPIRQEEVLPRLLARSPPWCMPPAHTNLCLTTLPKDTTPHAIYVQEFYTHLEHYSTSLHVYTDGSKTINGTGCAFFVNETAYPYPLSPTCSVYTA